jgi:hypothetical protein
VLDVAAAVALPDRSGGPGGSGSAALAAAAAGDSDTDGSEVELEHALRRLVFGCLSPRSSGKPSGVAAVVAAPPSSDDDDNSVIAEFRATMRLDQNVSA